MRAIIYSLFIIALVTPQTSRSEIIQIPCHHAKGFYIGNGTFVRVDSFQLDPIPTRIKGAWIQLSGCFSPGLILCSGDTLSSGGRFYTLIHPPDGGFWVAVFSIDPDASEFEQSAPFKRSLGASWDFLTHGEPGQIKFGLEYGAGTSICQILQYDTAFVTEAFLFLDVDYPVPTENYTWGLIKLLFSN